MLKPDNALPNPISKLIQHLQSLPEGSTFQYEEAPFYGGETPDHNLGTSYQLRIDICEGFNPPREK
jgi:hypothetical protein